MFPKFIWLGYPSAVSPIKKAWFWVGAWPMRSNSFIHLFLHSVNIYESSENKHYFSKWHVVLWSRYTSLLGIVYVYLYAYVPMHVHVYICVLMYIHLGVIIKRRGSSQKERWVLGFGAHVYGFQMLLISKDISTISKQNYMMSSGLRPVALINFDFN